MGLLCVLLVWLRTRKDEKSPAKIVFPSHQNDPLPGRIKVDFVIHKELPFGDKDTKSKVTLLEGDHVRFNISTDRRDKLERATNIEVLSNTFQFTNEAREMVSVRCVSKVEGRWDNVICKFVIWYWKFFEAWQYWVVTLLRWLRI